MVDYCYLLDTNIVYELIKHPRGVMAVAMLKDGKGELCCTSNIVACELRYGAARKQSSKLTANVEQVLQCLSVLPLKEGVDEVYADIRRDLERCGLPIGHNDLLIAAHAVTLGLTVVTANQRGFARINQLTVENWLNV